MRAEDVRVARATARAKPVSRELDRGCRDRLNREIAAIATSPERAPVLEPDGTLPDTSSPGAFAARIKDELVQWKQLAAEHRIVAD